MGAGQSAQCGACCNNEEGTEPTVGQALPPGAPGTEESVEDRMIQTPVVKEAPKEVLAPKAQGPQPKAIDYGDDASYTGDVADGKRHGFGTYKSPAETYRGQWQADRQHGEGLHTWSDGRSYEGQYVNGRFSGRGKMTWTTNKGIMIYEGQYENDVKHGQGKFTWPNGNVYDGGWLHGKRHGRATFLTSSGKEKYGCWKTDKFVNWENEEEQKEGS
eukprot:TRINITY_DN47507_c0_g1_i1.p1 TRINITY_DN47507_c0_g1~~TRINITY_DN47507_c0_g1_i1.p1  ORF type:complete len:250 (-),score=39.90 TRINITY_DN47507_c0_g1_i1:147-794(-)